MVRIKKHLKIPNVIRNIVLVVLLLSIIDVIVAGLSTFLQGWFFGFSGVTTLCNLLFLEGAAILAIGGFLASGMTWLLGASRYPGDRYYIEEKMGSDIRRSRKRQLSVGISMIIIGATLIGLSVAIGELFL